MINSDRVEVFDLGGRTVTREVVTVSPEQWSVDKGPWERYMRKEIEEQPEWLSHFLGDLVDHAIASLKPLLPQVGSSKADRIISVACGTAPFACHVVNHCLADISRIRVEIDIASEYRYRNRPLSGIEVVIIVSQSGETADTLSALKSLKCRVASRVAVADVPTSSISREAVGILDVVAGLEIGVASTKAFTGQALAPLALALKAGLDWGVLGQDRFDELVHNLIAGPVATGFAGAVVAQLFAHFVATNRGTDFDQSRNLAKSVTVE